MVFHQCRNRHTASKLTLGSLENYVGTVCEGVSYQGKLSLMSVAQGCLPCVDVAGRWSERNRAECKKQSAPYLYLEHGSSEQKLPF